MLISNRHIVEAECKKAGMERALAINEMDLRTLGVFGASISENYGRGMGVTESRSSETPMFTSI